MRPTQPYIGATGIVCPLGLRAAMACAALRTRLSAAKELPFMLGPNTPVIGAAVPTIPFSVTRRQRLLELLVPAVTEVMEQRGDERWSSVPFLLVTAEKGRPGGGADYAARLLPAIEARLKTRFDPHGSRVFTEGPTGAFHALDAARGLFERGRAEGCLVCAVDSLLNARTLHWLHEEQRLKTDENPDGLVPGEGAVCLWVSGRPDPSDLSDPDNLRVGSAVQIMGLGLGYEPSTLDNDLPLRADGMVEATRAALRAAGWQMHDVDFRLANASGESFYFKELSIVLTRTLHQSKKALPLWLPAESVGDLGAAAGLLLAAWVDQAFRRGYAPGPRAICYVNSNTPERTVILVESLLRGPLAKAVRSFRL